jgi:hypothetical protein
MVWVLAIVFALVGCPSTTGQEGFFAINEGENTEEVRCFYCLSLASFSLENIEKISHDTYTDNDIFVIERDPRKRVCFGEEQDAVLSRNAGWKVCRAKGDFSFNVIENGAVPKAASRGLAVVGHTKLDDPFDLFALDDLGGYAAVAYAEVGSDLRLPHFTGDFHGSLRGLGGRSRLLGHRLGSDKGAPNEDNTNKGEDGHSSRYYQHPKRPERHFRLGYQVALGALAFVCGLYHILYAFRAGTGIKPDAAAAYVLLGMAGVCVGVGFILAYGFTYQ